MNQITMNGQISLSYLNAFKTRQYHQPVNTKKSAKVYCFVKTPFFLLDNPRFEYRERNGFFIPKGFGHIQYGIVSPSDEPYYDSDATYFSGDENDDMELSDDDEIRPNQEHEQQREN